MEYPEGEEEGGGGGEEGGVVHEHDVYLQEGAAAAPPYPHGAGPSGDAALGRLQGEFGPAPPYLPHGLAPPPDTRFAPHERPESPGGAFSGSAVHFPLPPMPDPNMVAPYLGGYMSPPPLGAPPAAPEGPAGPMPWPPPPPRID